MGIFHFFSQPFPKHLFYLDLDWCYDGVSDLLRPPIFVICLVFKTNVANSKKSLELLTPSPSFSRIRSSSQLWPFVWFFFKTWSLLRTGCGTSTSMVHNSPQQGTWECFEKLRKFSFQWALKFSNLVGLKEAEINGFKKRVGVKIKCLVQIWVSL